MTEQLIVKPWNYQTRENEEYAVVDVEGTPIHKGAYVQVVQHDHSFLRQGEIVRVEGATGGTGNGIASLQIRTARNSTTGINSDRVVSADGPQIEADFQLAFRQKELAVVEAHIANLYGQRTGLHEKIRLAKLAVEKFHA